MARFRYYSRLDEDDKETYRASDEYGSIELDAPADLRPYSASIDEALRGNDRIMVERHALSLAHGICQQLNVDWPTVRVLSERPKSRREELHGLYIRDNEERPRILVWMRTAAFERPVAFRTFLRTLLHEVVHHLDYELLELYDSFHTHGFFQRESSLLRQVRPRRGTKPVGAAALVEPPPPAPEQLDLFGR